MKRLAVLLISVPVSAQTPLTYEAYEQKVLDYSSALKQSKEQSQAMQAAVKVAHASYLPIIESEGTYQYRLNNSSIEIGSSETPLKHQSYSLGLNITQPIYTGGATTSTYKSARIDSQMAEESVELATDNIIHSAQLAYWGTSAQKEMYETMCDYVGIIERLVVVLQEKYTNGYISRTDLLQMQTRLKEAQLQRSNSLQAYLTSQHAMNTLMGHNATDSTIVAESVLAPPSMPPIIDYETAISMRPDFAIASLDINRQRQQAKLATSHFSPSIHTGIQQTLGTDAMNITGDIKTNCVLFVSFRMPVITWGARSKTKAMQRAITNMKALDLQDTYNQIELEVARAMTSMQETRKQIGIAEENFRLAEENLKTVTFSYTEGRLTILDVLSSQLTWIQARTNLIQSCLSHHIAQADYRKATSQ